MTRRPKKPNDYWQTVIDSLDDDLSIIDRDFRIIDVNETMLRRYGQTKAEVAGKHCYEVTHQRAEPCEPTSCECPVVKARETGSPARSTHVHMQNHGRTACSDVIASPLRDSSGNIYRFVLMVRDISDLKRMEQESAEVNRRLLLLNDIAGAATKSMDRDAILNAVLEKTLALVGCDAGGIFLLDERTQTLQCRAHRGLPEKCVRKLNGLRPGKDIAGRLPEVEMAINSWPESGKGSGAPGGPAAKPAERSSMSIPLTSNGKILGVLAVCAQGERDFQDNDLTLLDSVGKHLAVAIENAVLHTELSRQEKSRRELLRQVITVQEEERRRISRELHDEISQSITAVAFNLEAIAEIVPPAAKEMKEKLKRVQSLTDKMLDDIHSVIHELRPALLDDLGLVAAVQWLVDRYNGEAGLRVFFETVGTERNLEPQVDIMIFRIAQEAITNIIRHARAESASACLEFKETSVSITIEDDGQGFNPEDVSISRETGRGLGLLGMKERAELMGGTLNIESGPGQGTRIFVKIPA